VTLYLDTSALAKLYVAEDGRDLVVAAIAAATRSVTSTIAYTEARSALARKHREGALDAERHERAVNDLDNDWIEFGHRDVTQSLAFFAGALAEEHALKGYDAVHLATSLSFALEFDDLQFLSFDNRLNEAARTSSLRLYADDLDRRDGEEDD
jgi:predicted nucleic acid-binding protein